MSKKQFQSRLIDSHLVKRAAEIRVVGQCSIDRRPDRAELTVHVEVSSSTRQGAWSEYQAKIATLLELAGDEKLLRNRQPSETTDEVKKNFRDVEVTIERIVGNDESVMAWWRFTGVHAGPWLGRAPTGERIEATVFSFFDLVAGRISRYRLWLHAGFEEPAIFDTSTAPDIA